MFKLIPAVMAMICCVHASAQTNEAQGRRPPRISTRCARVYFDLNTGINNNGGLLGIGTDVHVADDISFNGGIGLVSSWGYKLYAGAKYYLQPCHKGWAISGGITYSTGKPDYRTTAKTQSGSKEPIELKLLSQANLFAAVYHYWKLGRNNNRIYMQLGWSQPTSIHKFQQIAGNPITPGSASTIRFMAPGGPVAALGFSFGGK